MTDHHHAGFEDAARVAITKALTVSAVIPTYNRAHLLKNAIDSILAQTYPVHEVIVVDDGSTDGTGEMIQSYIRERSAAADAQIRYFYQENQGQAVAYNKAIERANGEWIAFQNSDDVWLPEKLELQFRALEHFKMRCGACFSDGQFVNHPTIRLTIFQFARKHYEETMGVVSDAFRYMMKSAVPVWVQTLIARADLVRRAGAFDPKVRFGEDLDFLLRLARLTDLCFVNKALVDIDRTPPSDRPDKGNKPWVNLDFRLQNEQYRWEKWLRVSEELPPDIRKAVLEHMRAVHSRWANWYIENRQYEKAREALSRAALYGLSSRMVVKWALMQIAPQLARQILLTRARLNPPFL